MSNEVICPYCQQAALRMTGRELYPRKPELANKHYHVCRNCDAWIGCIDGTWEPIGHLANAELRRAKQDVYAAIEPIYLKAMSENNWTKSLARNLVYGWLATELNMTSGTASIGDFDLKQCQLVLLICNYRDPDLKAIHDARKISRPPASRNRKTNFQRKLGQKSSLRT